MQKNIGAMIANTWQICINALVFTQKKNSQTIGSVLIGSVKTLKVNIHNITKGKEIK